MRISNDEVWLQVADTISQRSTCTRRQVGCVITSEDGRVLATGYNGVPSGTRHCRDGTHCEGASAPSGQGLDACLAIHAEINAVTRLRGNVPHTAYCTTSPCVSCAKALVSVGIRRLILRSEYSDLAGKLYCEAVGINVEIHRGI